jgi:hypothetical protein
MRKLLKINFVDFWPNFLKEDNYFYHLLSREFNVAIDEHDPDLLFFSADYSKVNERGRFVNHRCKKIFFTGEGIIPNFDGPLSIETRNYSIGQCDYAFSFEHSNDRNYRLPLWVLFINWFKVPHINNRDISFLTCVDNLLRPLPQYPKSKFCNFVFSNPSGERTSILEALQRHKNVDCAGALHNNMPNGWKVQGRGDQKEKVLFLSDYKFTIAAENKKRDGYTTEKIFHPLSVGSVPVYWGSESVSHDFNPQRFINADKFASYDELAQEVIRIDENENSYKEIMSQPIFTNNEMPSFARPENVLAFFKETILQ